MAGEDIQSWSKVAADNGTADSAIDWHEGQARRSVNNSSRSEMAAHAKKRDLENGSIATTGTANAQAFLSGVSYTAMPPRLYVKLKVGPALTNTTTLTLNMDGIGDIAVKLPTMADCTGGEFTSDHYVDLLYDGTFWIYLYSAGNFAPLNSPVFIGDPQAPTPSDPFDADNSIATTAWVQQLIFGGQGIVLSQQVFPANGNYSPTPSMKSAIVECIGGGGGGGGARGQSGYYHTGGGGGAGGYSRRLLTAAEIGAGQVITVGPGGAGSTGGDVDGSAGGATSFGALVIANGGAGGGSAVLKFGQGGAGGSTSGAVGTITAAGAPGGVGASGSTASASASGEGGSGPFGGGGQSVGTSTGFPTAGNPGSNYGSGGAGGANVASNGSMAGGAGSAGICIVTEFAGVGQPGEQGPPGPIGPAGPAGPGTGDVLRSGTPTAGQWAQWTDASHIKGVTASLVFPPQGRLTFATGTPVMTSTVTGATTVFYTPHVGQTVPIYDGTTFQMVDIGGELSCLATDTTKNPTAIGASKVNDWFIWLDGTTPRLGHGPDWTNDTTRSAGTALTRVKGIWLNNAAITNGPAASRGTFVGTTRSNGGSTFDWIYGAFGASGGTNTRFCVCNYYNRVKVGSFSGTTTSSWVYSSTAWRQPNGEAGPAASFVSCIAEDSFGARYSTHLFGNAYPGVGIGYDSTSAPSGTTASVSTTGDSAHATAVFSTTALGYHTVYAIEAATGTSCSFYGSVNARLQTGMHLEALM